MIINEREIYINYLARVVIHIYATNCCSKVENLYTILNSCHLSHLFSVYPLVDHVPERAPVSVQSSAALGVWLAKGQKVIRGTDSGGQTMVVDLTEKTCNVT